MSLTTGTSSSKPSAPERSTASTDSFGGEIARVSLRDTCNMLGIMGKTIKADEGYRLSLERNGIVVSKGSKRGWIPASNVLGVEWKD
jgi:hypothetical protein